MPAFYLQQRIAAACALLALMSHPIILVHLTLSAYLLQRLFCTTQFVLEEQL